MDKEVKSYQLNLDGKKELKALLEASGCRVRDLSGIKIWNRSDLAKKLGLNRDTLGKILQAVDPSATLNDFGEPVLEGTLIKLFTGLKCSTEESSLSKFWIEAEDDTIGHRPEQLARLLRSLDYTEQQAEFYRYLTNSNGAAAFLIPTPCVHTQRWAIHHLAYKIKNRNKAFRIPLIDVQEYVGLGDTEFLWRHLATKLRIRYQPTDAVKDKILQILSKPKKNIPVIISLYNFANNDEYTPEDVIQDFWIPLLQKTSKIPITSRIVLLIADNKFNIPNHIGLEVGTVNMLQSLEFRSIDVEEWLNDPSVKSWYCNQYDAKWREDFLENRVKNETPENRWPWDNPGKILHLICKAFKLKEGVVGLKKTWECF